MAEEIILNNLIIRKASVALTLTASAALAPSPIQHTSRPLHLLSPDNYEKNDLPHAFDF